MKQKLSPEQEEWFEEQKSKIEKNPCIKLNGPGPEGKRCKHCKLLFTNKGRYFKCELRSFTNGPGTDHRANWKACGKFEQKL